MPCPFMFSIYSANTARTAVLGLLTLRNQPRLLFRQQGGDFLKSQEENMTETFEMAELMGKRRRRSWSCPGVCAPHSPQRVWEEQEGAGTSGTPSSSESGRFQVAGFGLCVQKLQGHVAF